MDANHTKKSYSAPALRDHGAVVTRTLGTVDTGIEPSGYFKADAL